VRAGSQLGRSRIGAASEYRCGRARGPPQGARASRALKEATLDNERAKELLDAERRRVEALLRDAREAGEQDRGAANEPGDMADPAERLTAEGLDDAVAAGLRDRLATIARAEARLRSGAYGRSVRSGLAIPDERLEADPAAELTVEEAAEGPSKDYLGG
jgi:DnaK suppressor protein